jgi:integrase
MNLREHDQREDMKVWLSAAEVDQLLELVDGESNKRFAFALAARCGLRSQEVVDVTPEDVRDTDAGPMLIVRDGKGGKYRETPIPADLKREIDAAAEYRPHPDDWPVVTSQSDSRGVSTRTVRRWIEDARDTLAAEDQRWRHLTMHDLRRTWATHLKSEDVDALLVCDWGGWEDLETFLEAYRGDFTPEAQRRERQKVDWL